MAIVNLLDHLNKPVSAYSGGMKRRLSLAISLLHEPTKLLVLDEPTVGIDPVLRQSIWKELGAMRERGTTIILTTMSWMKQRNATVLDLFGRQA